MTALQVLLCYDERMQQQSGGAQGPGPEDGEGTETCKAAASLAVGVGSFADPPAIGGLAHFCEHMLFMGTRKYPGENEFEEFLSQAGGSSNAYTDCEATVYTFEVRPAGLQEALDRFAQFFIAPLMRRDTVEREVPAPYPRHPPGREVASGS